MFSFQIERVIIVEKIVLYMSAVKVTGLRRYAEACKMPESLRRVISRKFLFKEISYERKNGNGARREGQGLRTAE